MTTAELVEHVPAQLRRSQQQAELIVNPRSAY